MIEIEDIIRQWQKQQKLKREEYERNKPNLFKKYAKLLLIQENRKMLISKNLEENYVLARYTDVGINEEISKIITDYAYEKEIKAIESQLNSYGEYSCLWKMEFSWKQERENKRKQMQNKIKMIGLNIKNEINGMVKNFIFENKIHQSKEIENGIEALEYFKDEINSIDLTTQHSTNTHKSSTPKM